MYHIIIVIEANTHLKIPQKFHDNFSIPIILYFFPSVYQPVVTYCMLLYCLLIKFKTALNWLRRHDTRVCISGAKIYKIKLNEF